MYEDFYIDGPSYFDEQIDEFKEALKKSVKEEFLKDVERLEKENEELREQLLRKTIENELLKKLQALAQEEEKKEKNN